MQEIKSVINPLLTLDYMVTEDENKYFDRKSAKIKVSDIADLISAFANAEIKSAISDTLILADFLSKYLFSSSLIIYSNVKIGLITDLISRIKTSH